MADHRYAHPGDHGRLCREDLTSIVVSKFAAFRYRSPSELRNQNDTRNQYVASVLSIPKFAKRRYRDVANFGIGTLGGKRLQRKRRSLGVSCCWRGPAHSPLRPGRRTRWPRAPQRPTLATYSLW